MRSALLKLGTVAVLFTACEGEENNPQTTIDSGEFHSATITLKNDSETPDTRWTYIADGEKVSSVKWESYSGDSFFESALVGEVIYEGDKISGVDYTAQDSKTTYSVTYNSSGQMQKVSYVNETNPSRVWNFEFEYENGRVAQVNKYRKNNGAIDVSIIFELSYDANDNVSEIKNIVGTAVTIISLEYNNDINSLRNNNASQFIFAADFSYRLAHIWGHQLAIAFSKHCLTSLSQADGYGKSLVYAKDSEGRITRVTETTTYSSGTSIVNYWDVTY